MILAVTGHRPQKLGGFRTPNPYQVHVVGLLKTALLTYQPSLLITGMALGVDQWAAELCLTLGIPFFAAIPFHGQEGTWPPKAQATYQWLLSRAAGVHVVCPGDYSPAKMHARNDWMVQRCQILVAVWDGSEGGTSACVAKAKERGVPICFLPCNPPDVAAMPLQVAPAPKYFAKLPGDVEDTTIFNRKVEL